MVWRAEDLTFDLDDDASDGQIVTVRIETPEGTLTVMAEVVVNGRSLLSRGVHVGGPVARTGSIGARNLRVAVAAFLEWMDFDELVLEGAVRTTGANPGRRPRVLRFAGRHPDHG